MMFARRGQDDGIDTYMDMIDDIEMKKKEVVEKYGPWTAHNIKLRDDIYTISEKLNYDTLKLRRVVQIIYDVIGEEWGSLRILDLGSLEGLYTIELGLQGARKVVGIEGRDANLKKAEFAKDILHVNNIQFIRDDVRNLSKERYGRFDIVLCLGILYHLDNPSIFYLLETIYDMCDRLLIIDTHIALKSDSKVNYRGEPYLGSYVKEFKKGLSEEERMKHLWSAVDNESSFLFSKGSLLKILNDVGFSSLYECHLPFEYIKPSDRLTLVAIKGKRISMNTYPPLNSLEEQAIKKSILSNKLPHAMSRRNALIYMMRKVGRNFNIFFKTIMFRYYRET